MPRVKKLFITSLLLISFPIQTLALTIDEIPVDRVVEVRLGQRAPYSGIMMDVEQFRYFKTIEFENEILTRKLTESKSPSFIEYALPALGGFILGFVVTSALSKK